MDVFVLLFLRKTYASNSTAVTPGKVHMGALDKGVT